MNTGQRATIVLAWAMGLFAIAGYAPAAERQVPAFPPPEGRIRVVIDADAANEVDDQYALALALLSPERFDIEGLVAAHYGEGGGPGGIDKSHAELVTLLDKAGLAGKIPIKRGSHPLRYGNVSEPSEGVDFIIERAMDKSKPGPLWVIALGPATDLAAAYLKEPRIRDRVVAFWHGRTQWPTKCWNFNAYNDVRAVRTLFASDLPFVLFDTGTDLTLSMEEGAARIRPHGALGQFLHDIRLRNKAWQSPKKGLFDLGDISVLVDPALAKFETVNVPGVNWDLAYDHKAARGRMVRIHTVDREGTFSLLERKLKAAATRPASAAAASPPTVSALHFGADISSLLQVEAAYLWSPNGADADGKLGERFDASPAGQRAYLAELIRIVRATEGGRATGIYWWEPAWVSPSHRPSLLHSQICPPPTFAA